MVIDRQANGVIPDYNDIFDHANTALDPALSAMKLSNKLRFKILMDRQFVLHGGTIGNKYFINYYKNFRKPLQTYYTGDGNGFSSIRSNTIWLMFLDMEPETANPTTKVSVTNFVTRIRYVDP